MSATVLHLLNDAFPGKVVTSGSDAYDNETNTPWSQTCWNPAGAYVQLSSAQEVAEALKIVNKTGTKFSVRATGHNPNAGFSSVGPEGVVLDVRRLQSKTLREDGIAEVGAGNLWGEVYKWLEDQKLSAIGGRDRQVGLAGFLLGGGMGAFPNLYGLGADGIKSFELVLADGSIINANAKDHPDLHRALKGGGSNFGIVTRFDLDTHPLIKVLYTIKLFNPSDYENIIRATISAQEAMEKDNRIGLFTNFNNGFVAVGLLYADWPEEQPQAFEPFEKLESLMTTLVPPTRGTLLSLAETMGHAQEPKKRRIGSVTTKVSFDLYAQVYEAWTEITKTLPEGMVLHYTIQPVGEAGVEAGQVRGGSAMGLQKVPQCWWVFTCEWPQAVSDEAAERAIEEITDKTKQMAQEKDLLLDLMCMSFATAGQKVLSSYGADSLRMLQETAAKYDPTGVFQNLQNDGFLLKNSV
ncbi:hypothetical protein B0I35DRAFT_418986 [Stachybotrys elegans]|uniref:FAD-binding PCMH-type domain-containing protein n=1 Tax=Stachybotrys elegans TaxID=80388 RepID=A0A8K0T437_9HYPO|nr:hypothetical protein B0I35DRAFT_418986 [Stachybotrys elegans]